jgi:phytoene dehydrogenase-like protein
MIEPDSSRSHESGKALDLKSAMDDRNMRNPGTYDVVIVGAGIGGLVCGTKLVQEGARVAICEAMTYPGGYMATYTRRGFRFPCGPLSFSSPGRVTSILAGLGLEGAVAFHRSHFRLLMPGLDMVISQPFTSMAAALQRRFPGEETGVQAFFAEMRRLASAMSGMESWEPRLLTGQARTDAEEKLAAQHPDYLECVRSYAGRSVREVAAQSVSDQALVDLLSQQIGGGPPMPALLAANMWDILCERGIWYPGCGIQGVTDLVVRRFIESGGELRLGQPVHRIVGKGGRVAGVRLRDGEFLSAERVISNADYKRTLLDMVAGVDLAPQFARQISEAEVTGSDLCVAIGARLTDQDLAAVGAHHVLYRGLLERPGDWDMMPKGPDFFRRREIEICVWSLHDPGLAPPGHSVVLIRCRAPYLHFAPWLATGPRGRRPGYRAYKIELARALMAAAEDVIPGLSRKALLVDVATPLTYEHYTGNHQGAVAGWSWAAGRTFAPTPEQMARPPVPGLYAVGHWAFSAPFLGAVPTAMHSGELVAQTILRGEW